MRLLRVAFWKLSVVAMIGVAAALGTGGQAFAATASPGSYGPPPPPVAVPPGGFTAVVTTVSIGPAGGTIGPVQVSGAELTITIPANTFPETVQFTVTAPDLSRITPLSGYNNVSGAGILIMLNGAPYPTTFLKAVTATFTSSGLTPASVALVWNGTAFVTDSDSTSAASSTSVSFDTDPDFILESPISSTVTQVPAATTPVTGKPVLGEGLLAGALILAGAGGVVLSRRRRARALPAQRPAGLGRRRGRPRPARRV